MKKWIAGPALAGLMLVGTASIADAAAPAQEETTSDDDGGSNAGLFGLIGLAGLAGLAGLKRRDNNTGSHSERAAASSSTR